MLHTWCSHRPHPLASPSARRKLLVSSCFWKGSEVPVSLCCTMMTHAGRGEAFIIGSSHLNTNKLSSFVFVLRESTSKQIENCKQYILDRKGWRNLEKIILFYTFKKGLTCLTILSFRFLFLNQIIFSSPKSYHFIETSLLKFSLKCY